MILKSKKASSNAKTKKTRLSSKMKTPPPLKEEPQRQEPGCKLRLRREKDRCLSLKGSRRSLKKNGGR